MSACRAHLFKSVALEVRYLMHLKDLSDTITLINTSANASYSLETAPMVGSKNFKNFIKHCEIKW